MHAGNHIRAPQDSLCGLSLARHEVHRVNHKHNSRSAPSIPLHLPPHTWVARDVDQLHGAGGGGAAGLQCVMYEQARSGVMVSEGMVGHGAAQCATGAVAVTQCGELTWKTSSSRSLEAVRQGMECNEERAECTFSEASCPSASVGTMEATEPRCVLPSHSWCSSVVLPASQGPTSSTVLPLEPDSQTLSKAAGGDAAAGGGSQWWHRQQAAVGGSTRAR